MTAEEFFSAENVTKYMRENGIASIQETVVILSKQFAKYHVEQALKAASENVRDNIEIDWIDPYDYSAGHNGIKGEIDKDSILNAYPLENIK